MADVKISGLPASTTPLDGTEVLPIVQGTTTKQVSITNVTAGRAVPALNISTSGSTSTTPVLGFNASNCNLALGATVASTYLQAVMQNKSGTAAASTNYVLSNDLGTDSTYYGEMGMNSSIFSASTPADYFSINNGIYYSGHDGDISLGSGNGFKTYFAWGTTGQSAHVINATGALGFSTSLGTTPALSGTTGFGTSGQVLVTGGAAAAPAWSGSLTGLTAVTTSGNVTAAALIPSGSTIPTNGMYLPAANSVGIATNSANRIYIDSAGNVGVGVTPAAQLHVQGPVNVQIQEEARFQNSYSGTSGSASITIGDTYTGTYRPATISTSYSGYGVRFLSNRDLAGFGFDFRNNANTSSLLFIDSGNGNVGIGLTANASYKLDVNGSIRAYAGFGLAADSQNTVLSTSNSTLYLDSSAGDIIIRPKNSTGNLYLSNAARMQVPNTISVGGAAIQTSGAGITFPATQSASTDVNTLDDYEEGTFTPTVIGTTSAGTATYINQSGTYTKVGRQVTVNVYVLYTSGTGTGKLHLAGLPFTSSATNLASCSVGTFSNITMTALNFPTPFINVSTTEVTFWSALVGGGGYAIIDYDAAGEIMVSATYFV